MSEAGRASPSVSLLVPNRNNEPTLDLVLGRLEQHTAHSNLELVVVDDGSTDLSLPILRRWRDSGRLPNFRLIERGHGGAIAALNTGLEQAAGDIVVQLDADASIETPDWLSRMLALFCSDERIGVVTGRVVIDDGHVHAYGVNLIGREGMYDRGTRITEPIGRRTLHSRVDRPLDGHSDLGRRVAEVDAGIGCCMMYRRSDALEAGGYDPGFSPVWFDDLDLALSIRRGGKKAFFLPDVHVSHRLGMRTTREAVSRQRLALRRLRQQAGDLLPPRARYAIGRAVGLEGPPPEHLARLRHHYAHWRDKWGFDFINPDMDEVLARWGGTEVCWAFDEERRAAGREIIAQFVAGGPAARADVTGGTSPRAPGPAPRTASG